MMAFKTKAEKKKKLKLKGKKPSDTSGKKNATVLKLVSSLKMVFILNGNPWLLSGIQHSRVTLKAGSLAGIIALGVGFFSSGLLARQNNF